MTAPLSCSRKKTWLLSYGATKSQAISPLTYVFTQVRRWHEGIWLPAPEINGRTTALTLWTGNTWTSPSRISLTCIGYGGQNSIPASAAPGFKRDDTWATSFQTRDAQIADDERPPPILCSARTIAAQNCWVRTSMI